MRGYPEVPRKRDFNLGRCADQSEQETNDGKLEVPGANQPSQTAP